MPSCAANMPARGIFHGALCGPHLPSDGSSHGSGGDASSPCLHMPSFRASRGGDPGMPKLACGGSVLCGARFGLRSLAHLHSCGCGGTSSLHLHVPMDGASRGGDPGLPGPTCGGGGSGGGSWSLLHSARFSLGSNASGLVVVASTAPLAGLTLVMPLVRTGVAFASSDAPPGSCVSTTMRSVASVPTFSAA